MQRVKPMICISQSAESYKHKKHSRRVADDDARLFVSMIERGLSLDAVIETMTGVSNTHVDSVIDARARQACVSKLIKSHIVRVELLKLKIYFGQVQGLTAIYLIQKVIQVQLFLYL